VTPVLVLLAALVAAGGALAVSAREPRVAALGTLLALVGSAYVEDPLPGLLSLAARLVGTVLAGYLTWIALRQAPSPLPARGFRVPGAMAIAIVAFVAGWLTAATLGATLALGPGEGPSTGGAATALAAGSPVSCAALGASFALVALAAGPVLLARDVLRLGLALLLLIAAADLAGNALGTGADAPADLAIAILTALAGAAVAAVVTASIRATGDLDLRTGTDRETAVRHRPADEAHRRPAH
jgi:hypothetical protein